MNNGLKMGTKFVYTPSGFSETLVYMRPETSPPTFIFEKKQIVNVQPMGEPIVRETDGTPLGVNGNVTVVTQPIKGILKIYKDYLRSFPIDMIWGGGFDTILVSYDPFSRRPTPKPPNMSSSKLLEWGQLKMERDTALESIKDRDKLIEIQRHEIDLLKTRDMERERLIEQLFLIRETGEKEVIQSKRVIQDLSGKLDLAFATIQSLTSLKSLSEQHLSKFETEFNKMRELLKKLDESVTVMSTTYDIIDKYYSKTAEIQRNIETLESRVADLTQKLKSAEAQPSG